MSISFIVSAYDRPAHLRCCLASLSLQSGRNQILVADNSLEPCINDAHREAIQEFYPAVWFGTGVMGAKTCYQSANLLAQKAAGEWLCFPSDDSYYVPTFATTMLRATEKHQWNLIYCDLLYDPRMFREGKYNILPAAPVLNQIDKTNFMIRREKFTGFPDGSPTADGLLIESLVKSGIRHGKAPGVLVVHN
jgi:hypothetical protein